MAARPAWLQDVRFGDAERRKQHATALDRELAEWTKTQSKHELAERLCGAGLPAAPVLDAREVAEDSGLHERGHLVRVDHPETGAWVQSGVPVRMSKTPASVTRPAPLQGQHSLAVLQRLLGMRREDYEALVAKGISGTGPV